jgi:death-on-curing family protein
MRASKRILKDIAKNHKIDPVELLVGLWDYPSKSEHFKYLKNESSIVRSDDIKIVSELIKSKQGKIEPIEKPEPPKLEKIVRTEYDFSTVGRMTDHLSHSTEEEVLSIHNELVKDFERQHDPISPSGVKNKELLNSALFHPQTAWGGKVKYPTVESAAAALMYSISGNHAFHNGNKRTAMVAMLVFLERHGLCLTCTEDDLFRISLDVAEHRLVPAEYLYSDSEIHALAGWIHDNSKIIKKGERPINLRKLRQILSYFGCSMSEGGTRFSRTVKKSFLGTNKTLTAKVNSFVKEGEELDKGLIKTIRDQLHLTPEYGIDTEAFYEQAKYTSSEFIIEYKNLLKKLSRV